MGRSYTREFNSLTDGKCAPDTMMTASHRERNMRYVQGAFKAKIRFYRFVCARSVAFQHSGNFPQVYNARFYYCNYVDALFASS